MAPLPRILLVHTGGTLGMAWASRPGPLEPGAWQHDVLRHVPHLAAAADIDLHVLMNEDSSDLTPAHWETVAEFLVTRLPHYQGAVVVHGTDTLAYTASALSFMLEGLDRPVVLTGAQRPIAEVRTDARGNLVHSVLIASQPIPEVVVWFGSRLFRGNRVSKIRIESYDAFESPGCPVLAEAGVELTVHGDRVRSPSAGPLRAVTGFETAVLPLSLFPGAPASLLLSALKGGVKGVVLFGFGAGNIPSGERSWMEAIATCTQAGVPVVLSSQCAEGRVDLGAYRGGVAAREAGAIPSGAMTGEAAVVKLMWLLARCDSLSELRQRFVADRCGEDGG